MEILVETEEKPHHGEIIGIKARKLPPDYEPKLSIGDNGNVFREFVVELGDYKPEDFNRDKEWKEIKKKMKAEKG
jgi:hypothetical protein